MDSTAHLDEAAVDLVDVPQVVRVADAVEMAVFLKYQFQIYVETSSVPLLVSFCSFSLLSDLFLNRVFL